MEQKYTLITGASSGIGKALSFEFAKHNHNVVLISRRGEKLQNLANTLRETYNVDAISIPCDITKETDLISLFKSINNNKIFISTLINSAGVGDFTLFEYSSTKKNKTLIDLNIHATVKLCHHFISSMIKQNSGNILNIASMATYMPGPYLSVYAASKAFILSFTKSLSIELARYNINVSALSPGDIKTEFQDNSGLKGYKVKTKTTLEELAAYTYNKFIVEKKKEIIPPETAKVIDMMKKSGNPTVLGHYLYNLREKLAKKLAKS